MRTPEEITQALEFCNSRICYLDVCPYHRDDRKERPGDCEDILMGDALQLIHQLTAQNETQADTIKQLTAQNETQADTIKQLIAAIGDPLHRPRRKEERV